MRRLEETREQQGRFAVSRDDDDVFVYTSTYADALRANELVGGDNRIERWLEDEQRWDAEPPQETWEDEELDHGWAPWEVRIPCPSHTDAKALAEELEQEGYRPVRRWSYLIVGAASREDADALAGRLHGRVEAGGELVYENPNRNPFSVFGGMGGSGTPAG